MKLTQIIARDIPDAWFQAITAVVNDGFEYVIDRGSYQGSRRRELDFVTIQITHPGTRPLVPDIPPQYGLTPPASEEYVQDYLRYLMTSEKQQNEQSPRHQMRPRRRHADPALPAKSEGVTGSRHSLCLRSSPC